MEDWIRKGFEQANESNRNCEFIVYALNELSDYLLERAAEEYPQEVADLFAKVVIESGTLPFFHTILQTFFTAGFVFHMTKDEIEPYDEG